MKFSVFKDISFKSLEEFIESLIKVKEKLNEISKKIILTEDITVYRTFSISNEEELMPLSKANLVSTSLNINECSKYLIPNKGYTHYLYQINLEKGSMVTICPYRILIDNNDRVNFIPLNIEFTEDEYCFINPGWTRVPVGKEMESKALGIWRWKMQKKGVFADER